MDVIEKYYINMSDERYYWRSTLISLMKKKYSYRQARKMLEDCPLTAKIYSDEGWAYFHDMDTDDWVKIICRWESQQKENKKKKEKKQTKKEKLERLGIIVDNVKGLQYKRSAIKPKMYRFMQERYRKKMRINRNAISKNMRIRKTTA